MLAGLNACQFACVCTLCVCVRVCACKFYQRTIVRTCRHACMHTRMRARTGVRDCALQMKMFVHMQVAGERLRDRAYVPKWDTSRKGNDVVLVNNDTTMYRVDRRGWCVLCQGPCIHACMHHGWKSACASACRYLSIGVCACSHMHRGGARGAQVMAMGKYHFTLRLENISHNTLVGIAYTDVSPFVSSQSKLCRTCLKISRQTGSATWSPLLLTVPDCSRLLILT